MRYIFRHFLVVFFIGLCPFAFSQGVKSVIEIFKNQIEQATPFLEDAITTMKAEFLSEGVPDSGNLWQNESYVSGQASVESNPIAKIVSGWANPTNSAYNTEFTTVGADNERMFILEVTFKTSAQKPGISDLLAGKTLLFIAYGPGPGHDIIYTVSGSNPVSIYNPSVQTSISGFICINKTAKCSAASSGTYPSNDCTGTDTEVNNGSPAGVLNYGGSNSTATNLFYNVSGSFSLCANDHSLTNSMLDYTNAA